MFSLCVNTPPASDGSSPSLRQPALPRMFRDALRWRHRSLRRTLRNLVLRRPRPPADPTSLYAHTGPCLAATKRPSTLSLFPNRPKSTYADNSYSDASHPYARSRSSSATTLSSCTDRDAQSAIPQACPHSCAAPSSVSCTAKCAVPPLDERWLLCSTDSFPTVVSAESATNSPRSACSVLRLFSKLPDVRDADAAPVSDAEQSEQQLPGHHALLQPECDEDHRRQSSEGDPPFPALPTQDDDDDEPNITVPIVATYPEDRQEQCTTNISIFGTLAPAELPHGDHQTQANAIAMLSAYAENDQDEEALGDMDLSAVDESQPLQPHTDAQLPVMHMDAETCRWVGNEQEFAQFDSIVAGVLDEPQQPERDAVFDISEELMEQWRQDGEHHNRQFANGFQDGGVPDIREMIGLFTEAQTQSLQEREP